MNRPGQQPQRPPNLGPTPNIGGFRGPYQQTYGMPPRGVMPTYPAMQNHRAQGIVPQPTPGFIQQRTVGGNANAFNFAGNMQQQQQAAVAVQQQSSQQQQQQHHPQLPSVQQQQPPHPSAPPQTQSAAPPVPPHIAQQQQQTQAGSVSNSGAGEVSLDPNDFPALGSGNTPNVASATPNLQSSYATQAAPSTGNQGAIAQTRDFGPDDFPALGGSQTQQGTPQSQDSTSASSQQQTSHPPGLNGFQGDQTHRPSILAGLNQQQRGLHTAFDADKRQNNFTGKVNQNWPPLGVPPDGFPQNANGTQHIVQQPQQQPTGAAAAQQLSGGPPGVPPPSSYTQQQQPRQQSYPEHPNANPSTNPGAAAQQQSGGVPTSAQGQNQQQPHPQTPGQQLILSPADRWGLLGLLALIKGADPDTALLAFGADVATIGLPVGQIGSIYQNLITPWSDASAAATVEPEFQLPACYNVQPPPPGPQKAASFSDETLFFMFYASPRDALQEVAAQELWNRNWRWHKELHHWLTKETGTLPSTKVPGGEAGTYTFWDPETWSKERKDLTVLYTDLEEKAIPVFVPGAPGLQPNINGITASQVAGGVGSVGATAGMVGAMRGQQSYGAMGAGVVAGMA
ncbi:hypothetical protein M422DRAFT_63817 [Sphaerobolus stellatus SS14]|nr:hypothetical protein M422DRAFT_63817 [Sphaerobolus stellatus SS14]